MPTTDKYIISAEEQKKLMLDMLKFVDQICRKNNIKYSLIGGSLIGAIRHQGYIPWDDDIDIILTKENYTKLKNILDKQTGRYQTLKFGRGGEQFSFLKLIDTKTHAREKAQANFNPNYGVYLDIFCYYSAAQNENIRKKQFNKIRLLIHIIHYSKLDFKNLSISHNIRRLGKNIVATVLGYKIVHKLFINTLTKYQNTDYVVSNYPVYGYDKEIQLAKNTEDYIDAKFENLTVMIFKNYDAILRTTFGDYMQLPPKSERIQKHSLTMWWREENE